MSLHKDKVLRSLFKGENTEELIIDAIPGQMCYFEYKIDNNYSYPCRYKIHIDPSNELFIIKDSEEWSKIKMKCVPIIGGQGNEIVTNR